MPLTNFGSILNFAEDLEKKDMAFYTAAADNPDSGDLQSAFKQFAKDAKKNVQTAQRTRRENVTEMILEPITGFTREPFSLEGGDASAMDVNTLMETAVKLEKRARAYYLAAAEKIKALTEVSRALKTMSKKHTAHLKTLGAE